MAKMVGMNVVVKQGWTKKAIALLEENLTEEQYKASLNEHLSFEIDSAINLRKAREILMRVWYRDTEGVEKLQAEGRSLVAKYPDQIVSFILRVAMALDGSSYYAFSSLTEFPFLFPFKYRVTKEQLMQDDRFMLSTFDATLCVALK